MRAYSALPALFSLLVACGGTEGPADTDAPTDTATPVVTEGTETVSASFDVDMFTMYESPRIARFDTMGGTRRLDGMTIAVDHEVTVDYTLRNGGPMPVAADDYTYEIYFLTIVQLGETPEDPNAESPPFFGPGAFDSGILGVSLEAGDDDDTGGDDQQSGSFSDHITFEAPYTWEETPDYLEAMSGDGEEIIAVVGGFSEEWFQWVNDLGPDALMFAQIDGMRYAGTLTITYEWSLVE